MKPYVQIADQLAERIATGKLPVGSRLPPQRAFAFEQGIAVSTASRVYDELRRRGLVTGEVGRGTFVSSRFAPLDPELQEPTDKSIDLEIVFRLSADAHQEISASSAQFFKARLPQDAVVPASVRGTLSARKCFAALTSADGFRADPDNILFAGNGKQAIVASFHALAPRGGRIAVEALTYPIAISAARMLGIELVPLQMDAEGILPSALDQAARDGLDAAYLQPTLQSPLVLTMSNDRRAEIASLLMRHNLMAIEDRVYGFLKPVIPLAAFAPDHVIQIDSLSKRLIPGMSLGIIHAPQNHHDPIARALRTGGWMAPSMAVALSKHWVTDGTVASVEDSKRADARMMFESAAEAFSGLRFRGAPDALHGWLELPSHWRAESFTAACADLGVAVAPGSAFAVSTGVSPNAVRIACSASDLTIWKAALKVVAELAQQEGPR